MAKRRRRVPGTWRHMKVHRGPDTSTHWAGPAFTLKDRAKAAQGISQYLDLYSTFKETQVLSERFQRQRKWAVKVFIEEGYTLRLFMGGDLYLFVRERVELEVRKVCISINYPTLQDALRAKEAQRIYFFKDEQTLPK